MPHSASLPAPLAAFVLLAAAPALAQAAVPQAVYDVIDAAADDPDQLAAVVKAAKKANPGGAAEIDAHLAALNGRIEAQKAEEAAHWNLVQGWTGSFALGLSALTGNTESGSFAASLTLRKKTPKWEQGFDLTADYKSENNTTTGERYAAAYTLNRNFTERFYGGLGLDAESDRFAGYDYRFSESLNLGYRLIKRPNLELTVEGGPALRQTRFVDIGSDDTLAARLAEDLAWKINPRLELSQRLVTYWEEDNTTLTAGLALTTKVTSKVSARAEYELRNEDNPPPGREATDTTTRATVAYEF